MKFLCWIFLFFIAEPSLALEDEGTFYREDVDEIFTAEGCGSFCISAPNYFESYLYVRERNSRVYAPVYRASTAQEKKENFKKMIWSQRFSYVQGLSWSPDSAVSQLVSKDPVRWSRFARDVGVQVSEYGKSFISALWREFRKPLLYEFRDWVLSPYRSKKLNLRQKIQAWALEQTVDTGASSLGLDSYGSGVRGGVDFGIKDYRLKFSPRINPLRGRYGMRVKFKKYMQKQRPVYAALNGSYCNTRAGFGRKLCLYEYELSTSIAMTNLSGCSSYSAYLSYQTASLDEEAYVVDGEEYDHKPWLAGLRLSYFFY